jgi:hypothetical protein
MCNKLKDAEFMPGIVDTSEEKVDFSILIIVIFQKSPVKRRTDPVGMRAALYPGCSSLNGRKGGL